MGIGIPGTHLLLTLWKSALFRNFKSVIELGSQEFVGFETKQVLEIFESYTGLKFAQDDAIAVRNLYKYLGFVEYSSIDLNGLHGALKFDLNKSLSKEYNYHKKFDLVTNLGTLEHCFDQYRGFENVHNLCKNGGIMIHATTTQGGLNHGMYNHQPVFFDSLASANRYSVIGMYLLQYHANDRKYVMRSYYGNALNVVSINPVNEYLDFFVVLQKTVDREFCTPFQGMCLDSSLLGNRKVEISIGNVGNQSSSASSDRALYDWAYQDLDNLPETSLSEKVFEGTFSNCYAAIKSDPKSAESYQSLGNTLQAGGKYEAAMRAYSKALEIKPSLISVYLDQGSLYLKLGQVDRAIESCHVAIANDRSFSKAYYLLVKCLCLAPDSVHNKVLIMKCWDALISIAPRVAKASVEEVLGAKSNWIQPYYYFGNMLLFWEGRRDGALEVWATGNKMRQRLAETNRSNVVRTQFITSFSWGASLSIGHTAELDFHVKMGNLGWRHHQHTILLICNQVANECYLNYWHRYMSIIFEPHTHPLFTMAEGLEEYLTFTTLPDGQTVYRPHAEAIVQKQWEEESRPPLLSLSDTDTERGWCRLRELGVPLDAWFVGLHVRESGFQRSNESQWNGRNADISTYLLAIQSIVDRGGWVIRMGSSSMRPIPSMKQVIDYANSGERSDWMDVFLWSKCRFFVGTASGPIYVPSTFGVPCVATNWMPLGIRPTYGTTIFIPKLLFSEPEDRYLSFSEILSSSLGYVVESTQYLLDMGVIVRDNTPEEINDLVIEMLERLEGKCKQSEEDDYLQAQFSTIAEAHRSYGLAKLGRKFLRSHRGLLLENG